MSEEDIIKIKVPKIFSIKKMRENPWMVSTIVFLIMIIIILFGGFTGALFGTAQTSGTISANSAGQALVNFLNTNAASNVKLANVSTQSGLYLVNIIYNGSIIPLYVTPDGKYFAQTLVPINPLTTTSTGAATTNTGGMASGDTSIFAKNSKLFPTLGSSNAKATVVEIADFQCPWCGLAAGTASWVTNDSTAQTMISQSGDLVNAAGKIEQLAQQGQIQFIFVPLSFLGQGSIYSAEAGFCAEDQGKFWQMHDIMFANQVPPEKEGAQFTKSQLETFASQISGIDTTKFNSCLENDQDLSEVSQVMSQVQGAGFTIGTPQFYVNGKSVAASWAAINSAVNSA